MAEQEHPQKAYGWAARDESGVLSPSEFLKRATAEKDVKFKVLYCGICHSDVHMVKNEWGTSIYPLVPGLSKQDQTPSPSPLHNFAWAMFALLIGLLSLKYKEAKESPFDTDFVTIVAFVLVTLIDGMILHAEKTLETRNPIIAEVIGYWSHLCEFLAIVLLLLMLVPILGWIIFVIWVCCLAMVTYLSYCKVSEKLLRDQSTLPNSNKVGELALAEGQPTPPEIQSIPITSPPIHICP